MLFNKKLIKYFVFVLSLILISASFLYFTAKTGEAYGSSLEEWRPSVEISKEIDALSSSINQLEAIKIQSQEFINKFENDNIDFDEKISECKEDKDFYQEIVNQRQDDVVELTKTNYATYFAKDLLDELVGNEMISDALFHWGFIKFFTTSEEKEILTLLDNYYEAQKDYDDAVNEKNNAYNNYEKAKYNLSYASQFVEKSNQRIAYLNSILSEVKAVEGVNGIPGESMIIGDGVFCHPCPGSYISSNVGEERNGYIHKGVDLCTSTGTPIYCACDGYVVETGTNDSEGNFVKIMHDGGLVTIYMHCSQVFVPNNVRVHKGDNIALVGSTGDSTGPHLHFQTELNGQVINGLDLVGHID